MKVTVNHPVHGEIVFEENFWTGKKKLSAPDGMARVYAGRIPSFLR